MQNKKLLIIGEVFVDFHLDIKDDMKEVLRLGGVFHAIRAASSLNIDFACAFYSPSYLNSDIDKFSKELNVNGLYRIGEVDKAPNIFIVNESDESGEQFYKNVLCEQTEYRECNNLCNVIKKYQPTDILLFPGRYNVMKLIDDISKFSVRLHVDFGYDSEEIIDYSNMNVSTVFLSTSTLTFKDYFASDNYKDIVALFKDKNVKHLLIKENRGGSWLYDYTKCKVYEAPAYIDTTIHCVGVGDVYNVYYVINKYEGDISKNMRLAAWGAVLYSKTVNYESFKNSINQLMKIANQQIEMQGVRVPWFTRQSINIYMAAPDFDYLERDKFEDLVSSLKYHNFKPRLPIRENGQASSNLSYHDKRQIYTKDIALLEECDFMIATLLTNDQGTLVEVGYYTAKGKSIIIYDPYKIVDNLFLELSCEYYCTKKSEVINSVFYISNKMVKSDE